MFKHAMNGVVWAALALSVGPPQVSAQKPERLDVRDMKGWSIVVAKEVSRSSSARSPSQAQPPSKSRRDRNCTTAR